MEFVKAVVSVKQISIRQTISSLMAVKKLKEKDKLTENLAGPTERGKLKTLSFSPTLEAPFQFSFYYLFIYWSFLGLHPWHMEVPWLGVESEL